MLGHGAGVTISCGSLTEDLRLLHLPTANTLMMDALNAGKPSVVHNTAKYLEVCALAQWCIAILYRHTASHSARIHMHVAVYGCCFDHTHASLLCLPQQGRLRVSTRPCCCLGLDLGRWLNRVHVLVLPGGWLY